MGGRGVVSGVTYKTKAMPKKLTEKDFEKMTKEEVLVSYKKNSLIEEDLRYDLEDIPKNSAKYKEYSEKHQRYAENMTNAYDFARKYNFMPPADFTVKNGKLKFKHPDSQYNSEYFKYHKYNQPASRF